MVAVRIVFRMSNDLLLQRIQRRLRELNLSERKACLNAGLKVDAIRLIERGHSLKADRLIKLATALNVPRGYLLDAVDEGRTAGKHAAREVFVRSDVQAGNWREAVEWEPDDWYAVTALNDARFGPFEWFGLEVRGPSMNRLYPEGTILICVCYADLGRGPEAGEKVICLQRSRKTGAFEATVKEYQIDAEGRHVLWPRSDHPDFQQPIILPPGTLAIGAADTLRTVSELADYVHDAGEADLVISARVIQSVRHE